MVDLGVIIPRSLVFVWKTSIGGLKNHKATYVATIIWHSARGFA